MSRCQSALKVHAAAAAYVRKRGIKQNVEEHQKNVSLKDGFFGLLPVDPCRDLHRYIAADVPCLLDKEDVERVVRLLFFSQRAGMELRLSIGAPTSPWLSNVLMYRFDEAVSEIAEAGK
jgi:RNA-directed DNA polymerase